MVAIGEVGLVDGRCFLLCRRHARNASRCDFCRICFGPFLDERLKKEIVYKPDVEKLSFISTNTSTLTPDSGKTKDKGGISVRYSLQGDPKCFPSKYRATIRS